MHSNRPALLSAPIFPWQGTARIPGTGRFPKRRVCPCAGTGQTERTDREAVHPVPKIEITPVRNHADRGEIVKERLVGLLPYYHVGKSSDNSQHVSGSHRRAASPRNRLVPTLSSNIRSRTSARILYRPRGTTHTATRLWPSLRHQAVRKASRPTRSSPTGRPHRSKRFFPYPRGKFPLRASRRPNRIPEPGHSDTFRR